MSTRPVAATREPEGFVRLPDAPTPEDMNNWIYFNSLGNGAYLVTHLGNADSTIVTSEAYISRDPTGSRRGLMAPDLLIAFNVHPGSSVRRNGYVISEQGKPPDFVLEIGSPSTGNRDATVKREGYASLGIPEYWRFDPSGGDYQGAALAGDRLVNGTYEPIPIEQIDAVTHQGYSAVLHLRLRWERGQLGWYDPETGQHILGYADQRDRADNESDRADNERASRLDAEARAASAEARVRELEAEVERRRQS